MLLSKFPPRRYLPFLLDQSSGQLARHRSPEKCSSEGTHERAAVDPAVSSPAASPESSKNFVQLVQPRKAVIVHSNQHWAASFGAHLEDRQECHLLVLQLPRRMTIVRWLWQLCVAQSKISNQKPKSTCFFQILFVFGYSEIFINWHPVGFLVRCLMWMKNMMSMWMASETKM